MFVERNELLSELAGASGDSGAATASAGAASRWKVGDQVQAKFSADGLMYEATIESVTGTGSYGVVFKGYNNRCTVDYQRHLRYVWLMHGHTREQGSRC